MGLYPQCIGNRGVLDSHGGGEEKMNRIEMIIANYTHLNKWLRMLCLKQRRGLSDFCLTPDGIVLECKKCRFKNNFDYKGTWN